MPDLSLHRARSLWLGAVSAAEQTQVDFEYRLQQAHVRALIQPDLVLPLDERTSSRTKGHIPQVDDENFRTSQTEQR